MAKTSLDGLITNGYDTTHFISNQETVMGGMPIQPNERFGSLVTVDQCYKTPRSGRIRAHWLCLCDCGNEVVVDSGNLRNGNSTQCWDCRSSSIGDAKRRHGESWSSGTTAEYRIWLGMRSRVFSPNHPAYLGYGGRGIDMDPRWEDYETFLADMGRRPSSDHMIERLDNNAGYWPRNCVWATRREQANNKRNNIRLTVNGVTKTLPQWSRETGIPRATIRKRYVDYGWSAERSVTTPVVESKRKFIYRTPKGDYATLTKAADANGVSFATVGRYCKSDKHPDWQRISKE